MGKQINYYMDYESFVLVAKKALDGSPSCFGKRSGLHTRLIL